MECARAAARRKCSESNALFAANLRAAVARAGIEPARLPLFDTVG